MATAKGKYVLENKSGQVVRVFNWENPTMMLVYRMDTRRIEPVVNTEDLEATGTDFRVVADVRKEDLKRHSVAVGRVGTLKWVDEVEQTDLNVVLPEEDPNEWKTIAKYTAAVHVGLLILSFILAQFVQEPKKEETVVTVVRQIEIKRPEPKPPVPVVEMSKKKIEKKKVVRTVTPKKKKVVKKKRPTKTVARNTPRSSKRYKNKGRPVPQVNEMGTLGVLGGLNKKRPGSGGLNLNAVNARGAGGGNNGGGGLGRGKGGGAANALYGKGLVAASPGYGSASAGSAGGYGTRGKGGGNSGYGARSMVGSSTGYFSPADEEMDVEGGLDRDQIAEVINRHMGEIVACYERGLQRTPGLSGRVSMKWIINPTGRVGTANVAQSSLDSDQVESCILGRLKRWKFPRPTGNVAVRVAYPFVLKRVSQR